MLNYESASEKDRHRLVSLYGLLKKSVAMFGDLDDSNDGLEEAERITTLAQNCLWDEIYKGTSHEER